MMEKIIGNSPELTAQETVPTRRYMPADAVMNAPEESEKSKKKKRKKKSDT